MEQETKHYLIVIDTNSERYPFEIVDGLLINTDDEYEVTVDNPQLEVIRLALFDRIPFVIGDTLFNPDNITAVKLQAYPATEI